MPGTRARRDVLERAWLKAWLKVRANRGAGVDRTTITEIEGRGVEAFLAELSRLSRPLNGRLNGDRTVLMGAVVPRFQPAPGPDVNTLLTGEGYDLANQDNETCRSQALRRRSSVAPVERIRQKNGEPLRARRAAAPGRLGRRVDLAPARLTFRFLEELTKLPPATRGSRSCAMRIWNPRVAFLSVRSRS
jgi:hypothetical protein